MLFLKGDLNLPKQIGAGEYFHKSESTTVLKLASCYKLLCEYELNQNSRKVNCVMFTGR